MSRAASTQDNDAARLDLVGLLHERFGGTARDLVVERYRRPAQTSPRRTPR